MGRTRRHRGPRRLGPARALLLALGLLAPAVRAQEPAPPEEEPILGSRAAFDLGGESDERIEVAPGTRVLQRPDPRSPVLEIVTERVLLPVGERRGPWVRVAVGSLHGWIPAPGGAVGDLPGPPPPPAPPDAERLSRARALLGADATRSQLGPFTLHTDFDDRDLLARLSAVAAGLPEVFHQRYGLDPGRQGEEAVILFAREEDYREFEAREGRIARADTLGYTSEGLSILFTGRLEPREVRRMLVHELTHLLTRRVSGGVLPPWVEEGLAEDLAYCRVDDDGRLDPGTLDGAVDIRLQGAGGPSAMQTFDVTGPRSSLSLLLLRWADLERPGLGTLVDLSWDEMIRPEVRPLHYAQSGFLVRYLLDGRKQRLAEPFRAYLRAVAAGEPGDADALWRRLGSGPETIERGFYKWLHSVAMAHGVPVPEIGSRRRP